MSTRIPDTRKSGVEIFSKRLKIGTVLPCTDTMGFPYTLPANRERREN